MRRCRTATTLITSSMADYIMCMAIIATTMVLSRSSVVKRPVNNPQSDVPLESACYNFDDACCKAKNRRSFAGAGLRRTKMRLAVLKILGQNGQPLSAPRILERLPAGIDRVTLYRTLNTLTEKKFLHRVRGDDQIWRYGMGDLEAAARHGHAHFVCDKCGTVECLSDTPVPEDAPSDRDSGRLSGRLFRGISAWGVPGLSLEFIFQQRVFARSAQTEARNRILQLLLNGRYEKLYVI